MNQFAWFGIGLLLLLVIISTNQEIGGWLLIITDMALVYNAHSKGMI